MRRCDVVLEYSLRDFLHQGWQMHAAGFPFMLESVALSLSGLLSPLQTHRGPEVCHFPPPSVRARFRVTAAFIHQRFNAENLM